MPHKVEILQKKRVFDHFFRIDEARLRFEQYDGTMSAELTRLCFERGDSVAAVVHDPTHDTLLFTEQFRYPAYEKSGGWLLEIPAGSIDRDETPEATLRREIEEEIGYTVGEVQFISTFFVSPGGTSERIHLYYVRVRPGDQTGVGGGVVGEGENIRIVAVPVDEAIAGIASGTWQDAKTLVGLLWLQVNRAQLG